MTRKQLNELRASPARNGNRIGEACYLCRISQSDLARAIGLAPQYVSDVKQGRIPNIGIETARKFADYFGCHIEDLFPARDEAVA